jgi:hypothetical protein
MVRAVTSPAGKGAGWMLWPRPARWQQRSLLAGSQRTCPRLPLALPDRALPHVPVAHQRADVHGFPKPPQLGPTRGPAGWPQRGRADHTGLDQSRISSNTSPRRMYPPIWITSLSKTFWSTLVQARLTRPDRSGGLGREQASLDRPGVLEVLIPGRSRIMPFSASTLRSCSRIRHGRPRTPSRGGRPVVSGPGRAAGPLIPGVSRWTTKTEIDSRHDLGHDGRTGGPWSRSGKPRAADRPQPRRRPTRVTPPPSHRWRPPARPAG